MQSLIATRIDENKVVKVKKVIKRYEKKTKTKISVSHFLRIIVDGIIQGKIKIENL
jgi:hypothetical protein